MGRSKHLRLGLPVAPPRRLALNGRCRAWLTSPNPIPWLAPLALAWPALLLWHGAWTLWAASQFKSSALVGWTLLALMWPQTRSGPRPHGPRRRRRFARSHLECASMAQPHLDRPSPSRRSACSRPPLTCTRGYFQPFRKPFEFGPQRSLEAWYPYATPHEDQGLQIFSKYPIHQWNL